MPALPTHPPQMQQSLQIDDPMLNDRDIPFAMTFQGPPNGLISPATIVWDAHGIQQEEGTYDDDKDGLSTIYPL